MQERGTNLLHDGGTTLVQLASFGLSLLFGLPCHQLLLLSDAVHRRACIRRDQKEGQACPAQ